MEGLGRNEAEVLVRGLVVGAGEGGGGGAGVTERFEGRGHSVGRRKTTPGATCRRCDVRCRRQEGREWRDPLCHLMKSLLLTRLFIEAVKGGQESDVHRFFFLW